MFKKKILIPLLRWILKAEHYIYCITGCRVELLLHKMYYAHARKMYEDYLWRKKYDTTDEAVGC